MHLRNIRKVLNSVFDSFIGSIEDENLAIEVSENSIISGGAIVSLLQNEKPSDYDIYFTSKETCKAIADYYIKKYAALHPKSRVKPKVIIEGDRVRIFIKSSGVLDDPDNEYIPSLESDQDNITHFISELDEIPSTFPEKENEQKEKYRPIYMTSNAITLSNQIQLIIRFYATPEEIHSNYDFTHCKNYWSVADGLVLSKEALACILTKTLIYSGSKYPLCSVIRSRKFIKRGWSINAGQYLKMLFQISKLNLEDVNVLEDQLIGVDNAYFCGLITGLRSKIEHNPEFILTEGYLSSIIDKIFN